MAYPNEGAMMPMTANEKMRYLAEFDRRWRERTPAADIMDVLPGTRVGRSEMRAWFVVTVGRAMDLDDEMELEAGLKRLFRTYRKEFPDERWD